jgi:hypothetical protein
MAAAVPTARPVAAEEVAQEARAAAAGEDPVGKAGTRLELAARQARRASLATQVLGDMACSVMGNCRRRCDASALVAAFGPVTVVVELPVTETTAAVRKPPYYQPGRRAGTDRGCPRAGVQQTRPVAIDAAPGGGW